MDSSLLPTRVRIPPVARHTIRRVRLIDALERRIPDARLTLICAPAGYGKTTLLAAWARSSRLAVAWLSVEPEDDDRARFFRALLAAWEEADPDVHESPFGLLAGSAEADPEAVLAAFITLAEQRSDPLVFVIDDAHLLTDPAIWQVLARLIEHLPPPVHLVLAGRGEPPLPLARFRARRELSEIGVDDLRLSEDESGRLLSRLLDRDLFPDDIAALHHRLDGWAAGLQLAGLALLHGAPGTEPPVLSGRHRFIAGYLRDEVLAPLPPAITRFLERTSILDRFCAPLCEAVTGEPGSREMIGDLELRGLFIVPLDDERVWFRYHTLFAEVLRDELRHRSPDEIAELHRRAARWYHAHDLPEPALQHAIAADDADLGVQIAEQLFEIKLLGGEYGPLGTWLDALPPHWQTDHPMLGLFRAGLLLSTGAIEAGIDRIDEVERELDHASSGDRRWPEARVTALRCLVACFTNDLAQAETYAEQALARLPASDHMLRSAIHHSLGDAYRRHGRWIDARTHYLHALELVHEPAYHIRSVHVLGALADLALEQGRLREAAVYWKRALALMQTRATWGAIPLPVTGWIFIRFAELRYEWNDLDAAADHLARGIERSELGGDIRALIAGYLLRSRLHLANGDLGEAERDLERCRLLVAETAFPDSAARLDRIQLELWLAQGRFSTALGHATALIEQQDRSPEDVVSRLAAARVLILRGNRAMLEQAHALIRQLLAAAETAGQAGIVIEALALQAIALQRLGDAAAAMVSLERALRLAEPDNYTRRFADLGLPMVRLLQAARSRKVMPDDVERLLAACAAPEPGASRALPEPLTEREIEVLRLIAAGLTNQEIGETLSISAETVKKHTSSIYGKLGVRGRTEAAARARELDLLNDTAR